MKEGLAPFENDKPKDAGISLFQAGSDNTPMANDNDEMMLKAADLSFAVANAKEKTKKAADFITVSNNENAIAEIIKMLDREI